MQMLLLIDHLLYDLCFSFANASRDGYFKHNNDQKEQHQSPQPQKCFDLWKRLDLINGPCVLDLLHTEKLQSYAEYLRVLWHIHLSHNQDEC